MRTSTFSPTLYAIRELRYILIKKQKKYNEFRKTTIRRIIK
jgi:hypothetical protein